MNNLIKQIFQKENLKAEKIQPLTGGQVNRVFLVNDKYIIRIGLREDAFERLKYETKLIEKIKGKIPVPKIISFGQYQNNTYQIQQLVPGKKLHQIWVNLPLGQKDKIIAELVSYLKILHQNTFKKFGYSYKNNQHYATWLNFCENQFYTALKELKTLKIGIPSEIIKLMVDYFETHKQALQKGAPCLLHGDLWLGNILIEKGKISGILEFEFSIQAPKDYELLLMEQFCLYPNDFAEDDDEIYCAANFSDYFQLLEKHYPEIFRIKYLRERLNLYHLIYSLSSHIAWRKTQTKTTNKHFPIHLATKSLNFIFNHGTRVF